MEKWYVAAKKADFDKWAKGISYQSGERRES